ncbi:hypothetical protein [Oryzobacter telluris]|uniref:hypothetical protein n=1 Tax=Oryzobacter telluris TaxID=3149179 RepID=UPI00370DAE0A
MTELLADAGTSGRPRHAGGGNEPGRWTFQLVEEYDDDSRAATPVSMRSGASGQVGQGADPTRHRHSVPWISDHWDSCSHWVSQPRQRNAGWVDGGSLGS